MATTDFTTEEWRTVPDYEGLYEVSTLGRVRNVARGRARRFGRILRQIIGKRGYWSVMLHRPKETHGERRVVHRLMMAAFVGPSDLHVNHIDGVKTNNRLGNLEYCTNAENLSHAHRTGLMRKGEGSHLSRLTEADVREIRRLLALGVLQEDIATMFATTQSNISHIMHGDSWRHVF